jgi:hypothetical protein
MSKIVKWNDYSKIYENTNSNSGIDSVAARKIQLCQIILVTQAAFFGQICMNLKFIENKNLRFKTMATDGMNIYYDPDFVKDHTDAEIRWVICHEIMHCTLQHFLRKQANPSVWNAAADYEINQLINPDLYISNKTYQKGLGTMPSLALGFPGDSKNPADPDPGFQRGDYKGKTAEQIYQILIENNTQLPPEQGWNYGGIQPPVLVGPISKSGGDGNDEDFGQKAKIGDYVALPSGGYGKIESIDPTTGDSDITPITEPALKAIIEAQSGRTVKKIS